MSAQTEHLQQNDQNQASMKVQQGYYISIEYSFHDKDNNLLGSSEHSGAYTFLAGFGDAIPGLEKHLEGAVIDETRTFSIPAEEAYGAYNPDLVRSLPLSTFPQDYQIRVGNNVSLNNSSSTITGVEGDVVTVDGNHPLAGKELFFTATISDIQSEAKSHSCGCGGGCSCS